MLPPSDKTEALPPAMATFRRHDPKPEAEKLRVLPDPSIRAVFARADMMLSSPVQ
jgi:hypothetical protein